ncbi:shikimate dehydrogenase [bacterium AH-315-B15]|nr:shikimate dehydrogenase [bacterium AH-315-B15]
MSDFAKYGLIGKSLQHSFSSDYFRNKFEESRIQATYENIEIPDASMIPEILESKRYSGLNVTIPFKEAVVEFLDEIDGTVQETGAANTLHFSNGKWKGYNTDLYGFKQTIKPFLEPHHERAIILGTGGAAKSVAHVLEELGSDVIYISRNPREDDHFSYGTMNDQMIASCKLIVNCTPVGMFPNDEEEVQIPYDHLGPRHLCIDLIYNPKETVFLRNSKKKGATVMNGETMLHQQAEKAWEIWNS